jgi:hypothetical protein
MAIPFLSASASAVHIITLTIITKQKPKANHLVCQAEQNRSQSKQ